MRKAPKEHSTTLQSFRTTALAVNGNGDQAGGPGMRQARRELEEAKTIAEQFGIPLRVIQTKEFSNAEYLSNPNNSTTKKKELETLTQSLKRALDRMDAVRIYAVKEGGDIMGKRVTEVLASVAGSIRKAIGLWEKSG